VNSHSSTTAITDCL